MGSQLPIEIDLKTYNIYEGPYLFVDITCGKFCEDGTISIKNKVKKQSTFLFKIFVLYKNLFTIFYQKNKRSSQ